MSRFDRRARRGAEHLDVHYGPDWIDRVNLHTLDLDSSVRCVLAQVTGRSFFSSWENVHNGNLWLIRRGFVTPYVPISSDSALRMKGSERRLGEAWRKLIIARRMNRVGADR